MNRMLTLQDVARARHFYEHGYWQGDTLYTMLRGWAETSPDRFALRDTGSRLTFRTVLAWVDTLAHDLHEAGVRPGDRVSIWLPSRIESALVLFACSRMGYVCNTSLHRDYTCREVLALLARAGSAALFAQLGYGADAAKNDVFAMLDALPRLKKVYRLDALTGDVGLERPVRSLRRSLQGRCRASVVRPTRIASSISPSRRVRRASPRGSCTPTIRSLPMPGR